MENFNLKDLENTQNNNLNIDVNLDSLILNLKIISKLKPGYKLSIKENVNKFNELYIDNSYLQYFYRIISYDSRETTILFLEKLDEEISKIIQKLVKTENDNSINFLNSNENLLLNISHNLNLSIEGLSNLINTYLYDEYAISKIEIIKNNFELKIRKISNIFKIENNKMT